jgi:hypothetical protein
VAPQPEAIPPSSSVTVKSDANGSHQKSVSVFDPISIPERTITRIGPDIANFADTAGLLVVVSYVVGISDDFASNAARPQARTRLKVVARAAVAGKVNGSD